MKYFVFRAFVKKMLRTLSRASKSPLAGLNPGNGCKNIYPKMQNLNAT